MLHAKAAPLQLNADPAYGHNIAWISQYSSRWVVSFDGEKRFIA